MTGAMYAAVSGLKTHMSAMNVISHNVSNVNTLGYKATRYTFNEALYTTVRAGADGTPQTGGRNPAQVGYGCNIGTIDLDVSTSTPSPTGRALDVMIDGDGFFLVSDKTKEAGVTTQEQLNGMKLTRLGNFDVKDGYLIDGNGEVVYGFLNSLSGEGEDATAEVSPVLTAIRLPNSYTTEEVIGGEDGEEPKTVVRTHVLLPNYNAQDGTVMDNTTLPDGAPEGAEVTRMKDNSFSISETGVITAMTNDDTMVVVGYLAIGKVDSPNGVTHVDGRYFQALDGAGDVHLTSVGGMLQYLPNAEEGGDAVATELAVESAGDTGLVTACLESSGTDLAQEITNMIVIQRGYQANTRIVTVTDSMLEELVNMKR